jgi:hypothetical protein
MSRKITLAGIFALTLAYAGSYLLYRLVYPDAALDYVGGHVIRPSWFWPNRSSGADFTFNSSLRRWGSAFIGESFAGESLVTRLSDATGSDVAEIANFVFYPAARIDHLFTGRYIRFRRSAARPIFSSRAESLKTIDISFAPDGADFAGFGAFRASR